jgi:hypothetical protein
MNERRFENAKAQRLKEGLESGEGIWRYAAPQHPLRIEAGARPEIYSFT